MTPLDYEYLRKLLKDRSGLMLSADKQYLVESRLTPVTRKHGLTSLGELVVKIKSGNEDLTVDVVEAMTTNESFFFRDKIPFEHFRDAIMPQLMTARARERRIRIWCAAASTGLPSSVCRCSPGCGPRGRNDSGPARAPAMRMKPQRNADRLRQCPASRSRATLSWIPRTDSGSTKRPPGPSCISQSGARSQAPAVTMIRS